MAQIVSSSGVRTFGFLAGGQIVSLLGSQLTSFGLVVLMYQQTNQVTPLSLIILSSTLPGILVGPFAGTLVDRWDRRSAMLLSDTGSVVGTLAMATLFFLGRLELWNICLIGALTSVSSSFQWPAYTSSTTLLVPKEHLARASSVVQMGRSLVQILAPLLAAFLVVTVGLGGILLIDVCTYLFAITVLLLIRLPRPQGSGQHPGKRPSLLQETRQGWEYLASRSGLLGLLALFAVVNFALSFLIVLMAPLALNLGSAKVLGLIGSVSSGGVLAGSAVMTAWGGPKRNRVSFIAALMALMGLFFVLMGGRPSVPLITAAMFGAMFFPPFVNATSQALWQTKVAPELQGRVFALRLMLASSMRPLAYFLAGPLADRVFEPMMQPGGVLAQQLAWLIGSGPGRGVALLISLIGIFIMLVAGIAILFPRLRRLEEELPDTISSETEVRTGQEAAKPGAEPVAASPSAPDA